MLKKAILKDIVEGSMGKRFPIYNDTKIQRFWEKTKFLVDIGQIEELKNGQMDKLKNWKMEKLKKGQIEQWRN